MAPSSNQLVQQAKIAALLRYSPQREALSQLTREAQENYKGAVQGAESSGRLTKSAIQQAVPVVSGIYSRAQGSTASTQAQLASTLAGLGPAVSGFAAAAANEGAAGKEKLSREQASTEGNLQTQQVAASEAPQFAKTLAGQQLAKSLSKIFSSAQGIASNEGAATASELGKLENQAEGRQTTERGQNITAQSDKEGHELTRQGLSQKATEHQETLAAKGGKAGKPNLLSPDKQVAASSTVREIEHEARELRGTGQSRQQVYGELTSHHGAVNVPKKDEAGHVLKNSKGEVQYEKAPELKPHDVLLSEAALDSVYGSGRVSRGTLAKLHKAGYSIKALGLEGPGPEPTQVQSTGAGHRISAERKRGR